jgi:hypothetical protein
MNSSDVPWARTMGRSGGSVPGVFLASSERHGSTSAGSIHGKEALLERLLGAAAHDEVVDGLDTLPDQPIDGRHGFRFDDTARRDQRSSSGARRGAGGAIHARDGRWKTALYRNRH